MFTVPSLKPCKPLCKLSLHHHHHYHRTLALTGYRSRTHRPFTSSSSSSRNNRRRRPSLTTTTTTLSSNTTPVTPPLLSSTLPTPSTASNSPLADTLNQFCKYKQHPLSIQQLAEFGLNATEETAVESCIFVRTEVCTRIAHMLKEMKESPLSSNLMLTAPARRVEDWYQASLRELVAFPVWTPDLNTGEYLRSFNRLLQNIHSRHGPVVPTMAQGILELKASLGNQRLGKLPLRKFLDRFYMSRIGIRLLISQHLELFGDTDNKPSSQTGMVGVVSPRCVVKDVAAEAAENARFLCSQRYCAAPDIHITAERSPPNMTGREDKDESEDKKFMSEREMNHDQRRGAITFPYVPSHLYHILFELLKNSTRAVVEHYGEDALRYPPVEVTVSQGKETLCIRVSDLGGGIPHSALRKLYSYLYTTASPPEQSDLSDPIPDMNHAPLAGFGYGLPLSRLYARYFKGDLTVQSMEGRGTDAYVYLKVAGDANEVLPRYDKEAIKHYIPHAVQDWTAPLVSSDPLL